MNSLRRFLVPQSGEDLLAREQKRKESFIVPDHVSGSEDSDPGEYVPKSGSEVDLSMSEADEEHPYKTRSKTSRLSAKKRHALEELSRRRKQGRKDSAVGIKDDEATPPQHPEDPERINLKPTVLFNLGDSEADIFKRTIIGRDKEALEIIGKLLHPSGSQRPLLIGPTGIGKRSVLEKVAQLLQTTFKKSALKNNTIRCLDATEFLASDLSSRDALVSIERKFKSVIVSTLGRDNPPILYIRDIEKIMNDEKHNISDFFMHVLNMPCRVIASISGNPKDEKISKVITTLKAFNFAEMSVDESPEEDVCKIVKLRLEHSPLPNVDLSDEAIALGVKLAGKYIRAIPFPNKAMNLIHESSIRVLMDRMAHGAATEQIVITPQNVADTISVKIGISPEDLMDNVVFNEGRFVARLKKHLVGQDHAIDLVSDTVARWKMNLTDPRKPWGIFLFIGPTGVGKTELAKLLAKYLYQDENAFFRIDGSEYKEKHSLARLIGAPPGYEGHEAGGQLTEALARNRHMVVLFDESDKAHVDTLKVFLQVFDAGRLTDARGRTVDCTQTLFIMTSNLGAKELFELCGKEEDTDWKKVTETIKPILVKNYTPELINRFEAIVPFQGLKKEHIPGVIEVQLARMAERLQNNAKIALHWSGTVVDHFIGRDFDAGFGMRGVARDLDKAVQQAIKNESKKQERILHGAVVISFENNEIVVYPIGINLERIAERLYNESKINLFWTKELLDHFINEAKEGKIHDLEKMIMHLLHQTGPGKVKLTVEAKKLVICKPKSKE